MHISPVTDSRFEATDVGRHLVERRPNLREDGVVKVVITIVGIMQEPLHVVVVAFPDGMICSATAILVRQVMIRRGKELVRSTLACLHSLDYTATNTQDGSICKTP